MALLRLSVAILLPLATTGQQLPLLQPQTNTFNSEYTLPDSLIEAANLSEAAVNNIQVAVRFEQTNWATGSVFDDAFYTDLPANASDAEPGTVLKVEAAAEIANFTIAPTLALSRIVYQSRTSLGDPVPVSAFILWPYHPRHGAERAPLVSWAHGLSGIHAECAPSHVRNLWYQFSAPFELALDGYVVVATDYAGLGVAKTADGDEIVHELGANVAGGNDMLYAVQAARAAFPDEISDDFVVMGHSQGGGAAWGAAQQQLELDVPGYRGAISASPLNNGIEGIRATGFTPQLILAADALVSTVPSLELPDILTPTGLIVRDLLRETQACQGTLSEVFTAFGAADPTLPFARPEVLNDTGVLDWEARNTAGGKPFAGPMLVLQGTEDGSPPEQLTRRYVDATCEAYGDEGLTYVTAEGVSHVPVMYATRQIWARWLDDRFAGKRCERKCRTVTVGGRAPRPLDEYVPELGYFLSPALDRYQVA